MDEQAKQLKRNLATLKNDNVHLREKVKVLDKRLDMLQDDEAKLSIEMQALIQSMTFIMNVAIEIAKREGIKTDMGLGQPLPSPGGGPTPPESTPPPGVT